MTSPLKKFKGPHSVLRLLGIFGLTYNTACDFFDVMMKYPLAIGFGYLFEFDNNDPKSKQKKEDILRQVLSNNLN